MEEEVTADERKTENDIVGGGESRKRADKVRAAYIESTHGSRQRWRSCSGEGGEEKVLADRSMRGSTGFFTKLTQGKATTVILHR